MGDAADPGLAGGMDEQAPFAAIRRHLLRRPFRPGNIEKQDVGLHLLRADAYVRGAGEAPRQFLRFAMIFFIASASGISFWWNIWSDTTLS